MVTAKKTLLNDFFTVKRQVEEEMFGQAETYKINIMSVIERQHILSQIARGEIKLKKPIVLKGKVEYIEVTPDWTDRRNAIVELNKMDGACLPAKENHTDNREIIFELGTGGTIIGNL